MESTNSTPAVSKTAWWAGVVFSALPVLMILMGFVMLLRDPTMASEGMKKYGYPEGVAVPLLIVEIVCIVLYVIPQTAMLGAILLTGYLGGAVATHVRAAEWSQIAMPILVGVFFWLGLYLRDPRIRSVALWRR